MKYSAALAALSFSVACVLHAEIPVKSGDKVAFLGDSITQGGQSSPGGYVQLVGSGLAANGVKIEIIGAGINGHKSNQMLERLDRERFRSDCGRNGQGQGGVARYPKLI